MNEDRTTRRGSAFAHCFLLAALQRAFCFATVAPLSTVPYELLIGERKMFGFGTGELFLFALIIFLLFGTRLPATMKSLGLGIREFKQGLKGEQDGSIESGKIEVN